MDGDVLTAGIQTAPRSGLQDQEYAPARIRPMAASGSCVQKVEEGVVVRTPRDRFGTVMIERVQHNGVVGLTRECESTSHRGDPERGSVEPSDHIFVSRSKIWLASEMLFIAMS